MLDYRITSLADLHCAVKDFDATHLISLVDPDMSAPATPANMRGRHLILFLHDLDVIDDGSRPGNPCLDHVSDIMDFSLKHLATDNIRAVFQCTAGRRRSAAAALLSDLMIQISRGKSLTMIILRGWQNLLNR